MKFNFEGAKKEIKKVARKAGLVAGLGAVVSGGITEKTEAQKAPVKNLHEAIVTNDPNDPKLKAYKDSLYLYNRNLEDNVYYGKVHTEAAKKDGSIPFIEDVELRNIGSDDQRPKAHSEKQPIKPIGGRMYGRVSKDFWGNADKIKKEELLNYGLPSSKAWSGGFSVGRSGGGDEKRRDKLISAWHIQPSDFSDDTRGDIVPQYKKPVQPIIYKPKQEVKIKQEKERIKIYTDKAKFDKANKEYKDSLKLYNGTQPMIDHWLKSHDPEITVKDLGNIPLNKVVRSTFDATDIDKNSKIKPQHYRRTEFVYKDPKKPNEIRLDEKSHAYNDVPVYKKPLVRPVYKPLPEKPAEAKPVENVKPAEPLSSYKPAEKPKETAPKQFVPKDTLHRQPAPGYSGLINLVYEKPGGKILFYENKNGDKIPYGDSTKITKDFQYPDFNFK